MVKVIVFDITGVIFPKQPWVSVRPSSEELKKIKKIATDIYNNNGATKENLKVEIFNEGRPQAELEAIYNSLTVIDENILNLIKDLSLKYPLYSIANEADKWTDIRDEINPFKKYFQKVYVSCEVGMRKPDKGIFELMLYESGYEASVCLFIDDKQENVDAARKLGFVTLLYTDYKSLVDFLAEQLVIPNTTLQN